jgi:SAM-dependent methyltransferase
VSASTNLAVAMPPAVRDLRALLNGIGRKYPGHMVADQLNDIPRVAFELELVLQHSKQPATICDLGGGLGAFSVACAALGMDSILVDDFRDPVNEKFGQAGLDVHHEYGVRVMPRDLVEQGLDFPDGSIDIFTIFDSMEHWHHSPRKVFKSVVRALRPGGLFVLSGPNCVNLRKRITGLLGRAKWSAMRDWYEAERFRGHVREPDVDDLRYIARDMGLVNVRILGRNWSGVLSRNRAMRMAARMTDGLMRMRPSLCSDIYLLGNKPG